MSTIKDVAKKAGVSVSTASRALNDNHRISQATKERVRTAAKKLGYRLNYNAKNLTSGESNIVGLILPVTGQEAFANPFHLDLMRGIAAQLAPFHYEMAVAIGQTTDELLSHVHSLVENANVTKFLVFYSLTHDPVIDYLREKKLSFVIIGQPAAAGDHFVDSNNHLAGYQAAAFLCGQRQVKRPAFVMSTDQWPYEQERFAGVQQFVTEHHLMLKKLVLPAAGTKRLVVDDFDSIIASDDVNYLRFVTGHDDRLAALPALCFNNSRLLGMIMPQVIKVDLLPRLIGRSAVELLFQPEKRSQLVDFKIIE